MTDRTTPSTSQDEPEAQRFYQELDHAKDQGQGSCCTLWSFLLILATLGILGIIALAILL